MILGHLTLIAAVLFARAAFYVDLVEQPARLARDSCAPLLQWQRSCERAALMQAGLAMAGSSSGWRPGRGRGATRDGWSVGL